MAHVRFEPMLMMGDEVALRRRRMMTSALMAATLCMGAGMVTWVGDKMGISAVAPPKNAYSVSFEMLTPPPPAAPPPAVAGGAAEEQSESIPDEIEPPEPDVAPTEVPKLDLDAPPKASRTTIPGAAKGGAKGVPGGGANGVFGGQAGATCLIPPCLDTSIPDPAIKVREQKEQPPVQEPFERIKASSIYTPNPDQKRLSRTPTAMSHRKPGKTVVSFCINGKGLTYDVRVGKKFGGDPQVDKICRDTVSRWRFRPQKVGGKARSTCSKVTFDIRFD